jgi:hypothetical protein
LSVGAPAAAVVLPDPEPVKATPARDRAPAMVVSASPVSMRVEALSRSADRVRLEERPRATRHLFTQEAVNVRALPSARSRQVRVLDRAQRVGVTGETRGEWVEIVLDRRARWVHGDYLADHRPEPRPTPEPQPEPDPAPPPPAEPARRAPAEDAPAGDAPAGDAPAGDAPAGDAPVRDQETKATRPRTPGAASTTLSTAPCAHGSAVEAGLVANAVAVHRAVCAAFPEATSFGGLRPGDSGYHGSGQALDVMVSGATGDRLAAWLRRHAAPLGVSEVIWAQRIWTVQRSSEGWRWMEDRGSVTANHYDHVHVSVF